MSVEQHLSVIEETPEYTELEFLLKGRSHIEGQSNYGDVVIDKKKGTFTVEVKSDQGVNSKFTLDPKKGETAEASVKIEKDLPGHKGTVDGEHEVEVNLSLMKVLESFNEN